MSSLPAIPRSARPALARGIRLEWDEARGQTILLFPEGALALNETAGKVLELCDGVRTLAQIVDVLEERYPGAKVGSDVSELLARLEESRFVVRGDAK